MSPTSIATSLGERWEKCGIHNANRQALDLVDPKNLATAILTFVVETKGKGRIAAPLSRHANAFGR
jgi:hypothetical protein